MLTIRLARIGKKNRAQFQVVLQEHTVAPGGRHVEILGNYDPHRKLAVLKEERIKYWLSKGANPSDTMHNLFITKGIVTGEKRKVKMPARKAAEPSDAGGPAKKIEEVPVEEKPVEEPKAEEAKVEEPAEEETKPEESKKEAKAEEKKEGPKAEEAKTE